MKLIGLNCNHCGASLDVPENTRFVTCAHCQSKLKVEQTEGAFTTSVLEKIEKNMDSMAENLEIIKLQNELERLDRENQVNGGPKSKPSILAGAIMIAMLVAFLAVWVSSASVVGSGFKTVGMPTSPIDAMNVFGIVVVGGMIVMIIVGVTRKDSYQERRETLLKKLRHAKKKHLPR